MFWNIKLYIYILLLSVSFTTVKAQVSVESKIDSMQILIGQQTNMSVNVILKKGQRLNFPNLKGKYIIPGVEVVSESKADTLELDHDLLNIGKNYILTSFDENLYAIPGFKVKVDGKTYQGETMALKVLTVKVDTLHPNQFYPPKDVQDNPFSWNEWRLSFLLSILVVILCGLGVYLILRLKDNKPIIRKINFTRRLLPHQKAMVEINRIKSEKLVTSENHKEYYTKLTDTIREYIEERFGFNAKEMTSSEIIECLSRESDSEKIEELKELFNTADLVKFAKYSTLINENDMNLVNAVDFINSTKLENEPTTIKEEPIYTEQEKRSMRSRVMIKCVLGIIAAVVLVMLSYIIYTVMNIL